MKSLIFSTKSFSFGKALTILLELPTLISSFNFENNAYYMYFYSASTIYIYICTSVAATSNVRWYILMALGTNFLWVARSIKVE